MNSSQGRRGHRDSFDDGDDGDDDEGARDPGELLAHDSNGFGGRNRFFSPPGDDERGSGRVFAAMEVPDAADDRGSARSQEPDDEPVLLECVDTDWFWQTQRSANSW